MMMMMEANKSLSMQVPNVLAASPGGGRFDFDDGGSYCGEWVDGKAHGHGVCTGPKNVGEYSGSWNFGFEMSGVYKWKNGALYEGRWQHGKRHGVGVEYNGKWIYRGEWSQGFKGRYGVKASSNSAVKYEGTWANGHQDGYGCETYSDGGYYQGQMFKGLRHGYGVRKSAPYGDSQLTNPHKSLTGPNGQLAGSVLIHSNSLQSAASNSLELDDLDSPRPEDGFKPHVDRTLSAKNGFVLVAKPLEVPMAAGAALTSSSSSKSAGLDPSRRRNSLTNRLANSRIPGSNQTASLLRGLRLRRQKSASDLDQLQTQGRQAAGDATPSLVPFTLSPEELDISDPSTVETYTGEWKQDKRCGHGVCERSDGLKYEGQWMNDMKNGYGMTTFKDGSKEEGKYKNNILIVDSKVKRFFQLGSTSIRQRIDEALKMASQAQTMALKKAEIADTRAATARDKAEQATLAAQEADHESRIAFSVARQYSDSQAAAYPQAAAPYEPTGFYAGPAYGEPSQQQFMNRRQSFVRYPANQPVAPPPPNFQHQHSQHQHQHQHQHHQHQDHNLGFTQMILAETNALERPQFRPDSQQSGSLQAPSQLELEMGQQSMPVGPLLANLNGRRGSFRSNNNSTTSNANNTNYSPMQQTRGQSLGPAPAADPFGDLFDHYRATGNTSGRARLRKQTSLEQPTSGRQSRQTLESSLRNLRAPSLDQAASDERQPSPQSLGQASVSFQSRFRQLVTSGEQQFGTQRAPAAPTPAGSSYILSGSSSPDGANSLRSPSSQLYAGHQHHQNHQLTNQHQHQQQQQNMHQRMMFAGSQAAPLAPARDVLSLADERLTLAERRAKLERTEFANYDFAISSSPPASRRILRRAASLSRQQARTTSTTILAMSQLPARGLQQAASVHGWQREPVALGEPTDELLVTAPELASADSSSSLLLARKPSLQVRYDPNQLGGLMSREEAAALSHAQREQRRKQTELAEERARRPLLHLALRLRDWIVARRLLLSVLLFNLLLAKLFADLLV